MRSYFEFAGQRSSDFGLVVDQIPSHAIAARRVETYEVPGRDGLLLRDTGAYDNVEQSYSCWFKSRPELPTEAVRQIAAWLSGSRGYQILRDSYDPEVFRRAYFAGSVTMENWFFRRGRLTLTFTCMPQRWYDCGQAPMVVTNGQDVHNRWQRALPQIQITGTGAGVLQVGGYGVSISNIPSVLTLDAETQNAYNETGNYNNRVSLPAGFPALEPGQNIITWSGGITAVQLIPRWWTL